MNTRDSDFSGVGVDTISLLTVQPEFYQELTSLIGRYMTYVSISNEFISTGTDESFDMITLSADRQECIIAFYDVPRIKISMECGLYDARDSRIGEDWTFLNSSSTEMFVHFKTNKPEGKMIQLQDGVIPDDVYFLLSTAYDIKSKEQLELATEMAKSLIPKNQKMTISIIALHEDELSTFMQCSKYLLGAFR